MCYNRHSQIIKNTKEINVEAIKLSNNIIDFGNKNSVIGSDIRSFLDIVSVDSENTYKTYFTAINDFFLETRGKKIDFVREADLNYDLREIENYKLNLLKKYKSTTVNTKMTAIKNLMKKLKQYGLDVNVSVFDFKRLKQCDKISYDPLSLEEIKQIINLVSTTNLGKQKSLLIEMAFVTAFRKESLLSLNWNDLEYFNGYYTIKTIGKGKKNDIKKIPKNLYDKLIEYKNSSDSESDSKIFTMSSKTVDRMMLFINSNMNFGNRNITFHSFKKSAVEETAIVTSGDVKMMQKIANHSDATTTLNSYMSTKNLDDLIVLDLDRETGIEKIKDLSKDELINLIFSMDRETQMKIMNAMNVRGI